MSVQNELTHGIISTEGDSFEHGISTEMLFKFEKFSSAVIRLKGGASVASHISTGHCLLYIVAGEGSSTVGQEQIALKPQSYLSVPPNTPHSVSTQSGLVILLCLSHLMDAEFYTVDETGFDTAVEAG